MNDKTHVTGDVSRGRLSQSQPGTAQARTGRLGEPVPQAKLSARHLCRCMVDEMSLAFPSDDARLAGDISL